jgi:TonB family protein
MIKRSKDNPSPYYSKTTLKITLVISFLFHVILSFALQKFLPSLWFGEEFRSYRVELLRPPVEDFKAQEMFETDIAPPSEKPHSSEEKDQDTISLDTDDKRYVNYARIIKQKVLRHWIYPQEAKENLLQGSLLAIFSLTRDGNMIQIKIAETSGYEILDSEVIRAISSAAPFPPFPGHITVSRLNIRATFDYRFTSKK